jgi:outer membrane protein assembly factor BamB
MNVDQLVFAGLRGYVVALDRDSGEAVWTWSAPRMSATGFTSLILDGEHLVAGVNGYVFCLNARTGRQLWENPLRGYGNGVTSLTSMRAQAFPVLMGGGAAQTAQDEATAAAAHTTHVS